MEALVAEEMRQSHGYGGRSVFGWEPESEISPDPCRMGADLG